MVIPLVFLTILLEVDADFVSGVIEDLLEAIFVDLLFSIIEKIVEVLTTLIGTSFLGIILTLILVGTTGMAVMRATS